MSPFSGPQRGGRKRSQGRYALQLLEKQNLKKIYGLREEQLRRYFREARFRKGETGPMLIALLERRLDNALFRAGIALTRTQARQMASHRLFQVNGRSVNIPSYRLSKGDVVTVKESKRAKALFTNFEKRMQNVQPPSWIQLDPANYGFTVVGEPSADQAGVGVDIRAVVEMFAR